MWYNYYHGPVADVSHYDNFGTLLAPSGATSIYKRTWNLSSIWEPDLMNDNTGSGTNTVFNYKEYQPFYSKYMVRGCKVDMMMNAITANVSATSGATPLTVFIWCDNNTQNEVTNIDSNDEAFIQPGRTLKYINTQVYNSQPTYFKKYFSAKKVLKRRLDEDEDYGAITTGSGAASGGNPPQSANMYLHMVVINNNGTGTLNVNFTYALKLKFYTKLWDYLPDEMDVEKPKDPE